MNVELSEELKEFVIVDDFDVPVVAVDEHVFVWVVIKFSLVVDANVFFIDVDVRLGLRPIKLINYDD